MAALNTISRSLSFQNFESYRIYSGATTVTENTGTLSLRKIQAPFCILRLRARSDVIITYVSHTKTITFKCADIHENRYFSSKV